MSELPKKSRTFFFSDMEGSTRLAQKLGEAYAGILNHYHLTIRMALVRFHGREIDTAGDGFFAAFEDAGDAVAAAVMAQQAFLNESWAQRIELRVRIGLHTGEAIATPHGFIGLEVHRAARVCSAAHGGQVLLSEATRSEIGDRLPEGVGITELGTFMLKDFESTERLFQLLIPGTPDNFPPPRTSIPTHTIAVMPFRNPGNDPEQEYFCDGMAEEIIIALGKVPGLQVVARSSSFALKGEDLDPRETGRRLGATTLLEGTVRKVGHRLRINAELVDVTTGYNLWSGRFDRQIEDIFSVQDEIARNITTALRVKLTPKQVRSIQYVQTANVDAYDFYLRGRRLYNQFSQQSVVEAKEMFDKAIAEDANYALAYCGLAECYAYLYMYEETSTANLEAARQASLRAIALDPLLAEAYVARGLVLSLNSRYAESEAAFEQAIALDPQLFEAWYWYGRTTFVQGKLDKAVRLFETAHEMRPQDYQSILLAGQVYADLGLEDRARLARQQGVATAEKQLELDPADTRALYLGANGLVALGEKKKGLEWLSRALRLEPDDAMLLYNAGCIFALAGMESEALDSLERSVAAGLSQRGWLENDSNLDTLRQEPRFQRILAKLQDF